MIQITEYQWQVLKNELNRNDPANRGLINEIENQQNSQVLIHKDNYEKDNWRA
jgi:hypothetical protein